MISCVSEAHLGPPPKRERYNLDSAILLLCSCYPARRVMSWCLLLSWCCPSSVLLLSRCYPAAILSLSYCYSDAILLLSCNPAGSYCYPHPAAILISCCYPAAILLQSCCYPGAILLIFTAFLLLPFYPAMVLS